MGSTEAKQNSGNFDQSLWLQVRHIRQNPSLTQVWKKTGTKGCEVCKAKASRMSRTWNGETPSKLAWTVDSIAVSIGHYRCGVGEKFSKCHCRQRVVNPRWV